jgi:prolyl oligopeptidase PreP (S9A serine peptidase family)
MVVNMKSVKASQSNTDLEISISDNNVSQGNVKFIVNTSIDKLDVKNLKASGNFTVTSAVPSSPASAVSASVNLAIIGNTYYVKVNSITVPASDLALSAPGLDLDKIKGKWFKFDQESMKVLSQASGETTIPDISKLTSSDLSKKFQDTLITENMFVFNKQLADEKISGQDTYHYLVTIDKVKLSDSITKSISLAIQEAEKAQTTFNATGTANVVSSSKLIENMAQAVVKTALDSIGDINMDVWIGKKDYMLYQVKVDKNIEVSKILEGLGMSASTVIGGTNATGTTGTTNTGTELGIKFNMTNSNFNKSITVQTPEGAQKIEEVLLPLIKNQGVNSYLSQIGSLARFMYMSENSYSSLCTRGLLNGYQKTYGEGLIVLNNKIINNGAKKPVCFSNVSNYCISTQLASGDYACIGNDGIIGKTKCLSALTVCK